MNILDAQNKLKSLTDEQLSAEMQTPTGSTPQFLVLSEINRRKTMRDSMKSQQQSGSTVADEVVSSAGLPQALASQMARSMAPKSSIEQNTGIGSLIQAKSSPMPDEPQRMAGGGIIRMRDGGDTQRPVSYEAPPTAFLMDPAVQAMAARSGVRVGQLWAQMTPEQRQAQVERLSSQTTRWPEAQGPTLDTMSVNPSYAEGEQPSFIMPPQEDLNRRYFEEMTGAGASRPLSYTEDTSMPNIPSAEGGVSAIGEAPYLGGRVVSAGGPPPMGLASLGPSDAMPDIQSLITGRGRSSANAGAGTNIDLDLTYTPNEPSTVDRPVPVFGQILADQVYGDRAGPVLGVPEPYEDRLARIKQEMLGIKSEREDDKMRALLADQFDANSGRALGMVAATEAAANQPEQPSPPSQVEIDRARGGESFTLPELVSDMVPDWLSVSGSERRSNPREMTDSEIEAQKRARIAEEYAKYADRGVEPDAAEASGQETSPEAAQTATELLGGDTTQQGPEALTDTSTGSGVASGGGSGGGGGRGGGGASSASGATSSYEQELIDALGRADKRATQDKWLALAQVGMAMMASKSPTLAGAIGEAGIAGLEGYRKARDDYENERLGLTKSIAELRAQRAAAVGRGGGRGGAASGVATAKSVNAMVKSLEDQIKFEMELMGVQDGIPMTEEQAASIAPLLSRRRALISTVNPTPVMDMTK